MTGKKAQAPILTAANIFSGGTTFESFTLPEIKVDGVAGVVHLKPLSAGAVLDFMEAQKGGNDEALMELIAKAVVTPKGEALFQGEDIKQLRDIPIAAFNRLAKKVTEMAGMGTAAEADDEEAAGN